MRADPLYSPGSNTSRYALVNEKDENFATDFILDLMESNESEFEKLISAIDRIRDHGVPINEQKFKKLEPGLFEIKSGPTRLLCFFDGNDQSGNTRLVITHGFWKKTNRTPMSEIEHARTMREQYTLEQGA